MSALIAYPPSAIRFSLSQIYLFLAPLLHRDASVLSSVIWLEPRVRARSAHTRAPDTFSLCLSVSSLCVTVFSRLEQPLHRERPDASGGRNFFFSFFFRLPFFLCSTEERTTVYTMACAYNPDRPCADRHTRVSRPPPTSINHRSARQSQPSPVLFRHCTSYRH